MTAVVSSGAMAVAFAACLAVGVMSLVESERKAGLGIARLDIVFINFKMQFLRLNRTILLASQMLYVEISIVCSSCYSICNQTLRRAI